MFVSPGSRFSRRRARPATEAFGPFTSLPSAATTNLATVPTVGVSITGTTTITSFGGGQNLMRAIKFTGILTLTYSATALILPGAANITTAAGDRCLALSDANGNWIVMAYTKADGTPVVAGSVTAAQINSAYGPSLANYVIDGGVDICQPGNTFTVGTSAAWNAAGPDMFMVWATGTAVNAGTCSQGTAGNCGGRTGNELKAGGMTITGTGKVFMRTRIEGADAIKLKNATGGFAVRVYQDTGGAINVVQTIRKANALNNFGGGTTSVATQTISVANTTATLLSLANVSLGDVSNGIELELEFDCGAITTKNFYAAEWWVYEGATIPAVYPREQFTTLLTRVRDRYRRRSYAYGTANANATHNNMWCLGYQTSSFEPRLNFEQPMVQAPTISVWDGAGTTNKTSYYTSSGPAYGDALTSVTVATPDTGGAIIDVGSNAGVPVLIHYDADARLT